MTRISADLRSTSIPDLAEWREGRNGLPCLEVRSRHAEAHIYLHGAHVTHFQPTGRRPFLFVSEKSHFADGKPIRGGVPVIFPWFGPRQDDPGAPMHGFARTRSWEVESLESWGDQVVSLVLRLVADDATRAAWPHDFLLRHRITIGATLEMSLEVENWCREPFTFEEALHSYFQVRDVEQIEVAGLQGVDYLDKTDGFRRKKEEAEAIRLTGETDRIYLDTKSACVIRDPAWDRAIRIQKEGSDTTVVWNPWDKKAAALADMAPTEWKHFVCVETASAGENAVHLAPGAAYVMRATVAAV